MLKSISSKKLVDNRFLTHLFQYLFYRFFITPNQKTMNSILKEKRIIQIFMLTISFIALLLFSCNNEEFEDFSQVVVEEDIIEEEEGDLPEDTSEITVPVVVGDTINTSQNTTISINLFENDEYIPSQAIVSFTEPSNGIIIINDNDTPDVINDDTLDFVPNAGFFGDDTFEYTICHTESPDVCATAVVEITVNEVIVDEDVSTVLKAFPGAEGYGKNAVGGRDGRIIKVTNLNDSGTGSFRAACETSGARIITFEVGGRINLSSTVIINDPFITIAGQTAPGDGITLSMEGTPNEVVLKVQANDVIIRYLTIRRSETEVSEQNSDGLVITGCHDVIVDHCSFSWASDENIAIYDYDGNNRTDTYNVTIQNCLIDTAWGGNDKGIIAAGGVNKLSFYNLLFTDVGQRQPLIKNETGNYTTELGYFEIVNTVTFQGKLHTDFRNDVPAAGEMHLNYINNMCIDTSFDRNQVYIIGSQPISMYLRGNISPLRTSITSPVDWDEEWSITQNGGGSSEVQIPVTTDYRATTPFNTPLIEDGVIFEDAVDVFDNIKSHVGASLPTRDSEDIRAINDVENNTSTAPVTSGTFPNIANGNPLADSDDDGIPDAWEDAYGLNKNSADDATLDKDGDGYTNIEEYVNSISA